MGRRRPDGRDRARRAPAAERPEPLRHRCLRRHRGRRRWPARPHGQLLHGRLARPAARARLDRQAGAGARLLGAAPSRSTCSAPSRKPWRGTSRATRSPTGCTGRRAAWRRRSRACSRPSSAAPGAAYDGGDHTLFVGEVVDFDYRDGDALGVLLEPLRDARGARAGRRVPLLEQEGAPMGARTGREYIEALGRACDPRRDRGAAAHGPRLRDPAAPQRGPDVRELFDLQHDPAPPRRDDLRVADDRRPRRHVVPPAAERGRRRAPARGDARLGGALARAPRAHGRLLLEQRSWRWRAPPTGSARPTRRSARTSAATTSTCARTTCS